jgi:pimeloyl-ACP methyl ester carboxylesterase
MTKHIEPATAIFEGASGNRLVADVFGEEGPTVLLLHGGGQTRHAWRETAERLAQSGWVAYALDQRGHGDSEWVANAAYTFRDFAADAETVARALSARTSRGPVVIGASLGGIASLLAEGNAEREGHGPLFSALILVEPKVSPRFKVSCAPT